MAAPAAGRGRVHGAVPLAHHPLRPEAGAGGPGLKAAWKRERPWAVLATGGYGSGPALLAARALGIPYFLHESNAQPGMLVKLLAPGAAGVWCGMDAVRGRLAGARCVLAGTPVRWAFLRAFSPLDRLRRPRLLVLGGSGGARALNAAVLAAAPELLERLPAWDLLHQTGPAGFPALAAARSTPGTGWRPSWRTWTGSWRPPGWC